MKAKPRARIGWLYAVLFFAVASVGVAGHRSSRRSRSIRVGICANEYFPVGMGNRWEYDVTRADGRVVGSSVVQVVGVDRASRTVLLRRRVTMRTGTTSTTTIAMRCSHGAVVPTVADRVRVGFAAGLKARADLARPIPSSRDLRKASLKSDSQDVRTLYLAADQPMRITTRHHLSRAPAAVVRTPAGTFSALELDDTVRANAVDRDSRAFPGTAALAGPQVIRAHLASGVGLVKLETPIATYTLRRFGTLKSRSAVGRRAMNLGHVHPDLHQGRVYEEREERERHEPQPPLGTCAPGDPSCNGRDACAASHGSKVCRAAGCPGLTGDVCPRSSALYTSVAAAGACRVACWLNPLCLAFGDANELCPRADNAAEWESIPSAPFVTITGVVNGGGCGGPTDCLAAHDCPTPLLSTEDNCLTHDDRDFHLTVLTSGASSLAYMTSVNMVSGEEFSGHDIGMEWESMYLFPTMHSDSFPPLGPVVGTGKGVTMPWVGDRIAVSGALIADCGHTNGAFHQSRTEIHPPTALAWLHPVAGSPNRYTLSIRATQFATAPEPIASGMTGAMDVVIPLAGTPTVSNLKLDYVISDYGVAVDDSCSLTSWNKPNAHLVDLKYANIAGLDPHHNPWFSITAEPGQGGLHIRLAPRARGGSIKPFLVGAHADVCLAGACRPAPVSRCRKGTAPCACLGNRCLPEAACHKACAMRP